MAPNNQNTKSNKKKAQKEPSAQELWETFPEALRRAIQENSMTQFDEAVKNVFTETPEILRKQCIQAGFLNEGTGNFSTLEDIKSQDMLSHFETNSALLEQLSELQGSTEPFLTEHPHMAAEHTVNWLTIAALSSAIDKNEEKLAALSEKCVVFQLFLASATGQKQFFKKFEVSENLDEVKAFKSRMRSRAQAKGEKPEKINLNQGTVDSRQFLEELKQLENLKKTEFAVQNYNKLVIRGDRMVKEFLIENPELLTEEAIKYLRILADTYSKDLNAKKCTDVSKKLTYILHFLTKKMTVAEYFVDLLAADSVKEYNDIWLVELRKMKQMMVDYKKARNPE